VGLGGREGVNLGGRGVKNGFFGLSENNPKRLLADKIAKIAIFPRYIWRGGG
jgi:hypothetical protein